MKGGKAMEFYKLETKLKKAYPFLMGALLLLIGFLCFYHLDTKYVDPWDEARHGVNAVEMLKEGNLIKSTYEYQTDYYNLKPPLSMWCIMIAFKLFGTTVFAIRFYSAVCYLVLAFIVGLYVYKRYGRLESLFVVGLLATNTTAFQAHMIRAGDADSLYVLLFTAGMLCLLEIRRKSYAFPLYGLCLSLAFLTKSFHAGMIALVGIIFMIGTGAINKLTKKQWLLFAGTVLVPFLIWAISRWMVDGTTFFRQMILTDVLHRTSSDFGSNTGPFSYYIQYFFGAMSGRITVYLWAFTICVVAAFLFTGIYSKENRTQLLGYGLWFAVPFFGFSAISTKLLWYVYPAMIPLLIVAGIGIARIMKKGELPNWLCYITAVLGIMLIGFYVGLNVQNIRALTGNELQQFIQTAANVESGNDVYYYNVSTEALETLSWPQEAAFVAEAYGNYICRDESVEGFIQSKDSLLVINSGGYLVKEAQLSNMKVIYQSGDYLLLGH